MSVSLRLKTLSFLPVLKKNLLGYSYYSLNNQTKLQCFRFGTTGAGQETIKDFSAVHKEISHGVIAKVNNQIVNKTHGRLFAVVQLLGVQYKITTEDIVVVRGNWPPVPGDEIRLEKVLLVGSSDFTIIGRPLLPLDQVSVVGTVIEKTLSHTYPIMRFRPRKNFMKLNFYKDEMTYLRITSINFISKVNELGDTDGLKDRIF